MTDTPDATPALKFPTPPESMEQIVAQYVKIRDRLKAADDAHKEKTKPVKDYLAQLDAKLLQKLNEMEGDSVKTAAGTAYRTTRKSATIADGSMFREFVINNEAYDVVDWRANATAVGDFIAANGSPPPGVNFNTAFTVGVRRS